VLGVSNHVVRDVAGVRLNELKGFFEYSEEQPKYKAPDLPGGEYNYVGLFLGSFLTVLRTSLGDFDFGGSTFLTEEENYIFWLIWFFIVVSTCIIFLNFIIAEASASYENVKERLEAEIMKAKA